MVPEDRRARGHRLELPPVPLGDRVLLPTSARYDVRLTVPRGWIVGATGVERDRRDEADGTTTHHYYQDDVHDFAWTTSPRLHRAARPRSNIRPCRRSTCGCCCSRSMPARPTAISRPRARRCKDFGEWFGPYPYGHITIVDPAWQSGAGGMDTRRCSPRDRGWLAPRDADRPEDVTVHEAGHQFWYGHRRHQRVRARLDGRRVQDLCDGPRHRAAFAGTSTPKRYFGGFIPWVFRGFPAYPRGGGRSDGRAIAPRRAPTCSRPRRSGTGRATAGSDQLHQDRALAAHARAACSAGRRCSESCPPISRGGCSATPGRRTSSPS